MITYTLFITINNLSIFIWQDSDELFINELANSFKGNPFISAIIINKSTNTEETTIIEGSS